MPFWWVLDSSIFMDRISKHSRVEESVRFGNLKIASLLFLQTIWFCWLHQTVISSVHRAVDRCRVHHNACAVLGRCGEKGTEPKGNAFDLSVNLLSDSHRLSSRIYCINDISHLRFSGHAQLGRDPRVDPKLVGGIIYPIWPGIASQEELESVAEKERSFPLQPAATTTPRPSTRWSQMDGWNDLFVFSWN